MSVHFLNRNEVTDGVDHPTNLGTVLLHDHVADPLEAQRAKGLALVGLAADRGLLLLDLELGHYWATSARALSRAAGATCSTVRPRRAATASGSSRSEEHTSELQSLIRISYAVLRLKKKKIITH